jgi:hypothetical protein
MNQHNRKPAPIGISITWHFHEEDARAVAYDLRDSCESPVNRADLRGFLRATIRRALSDVRSRYENRTAEEQLLMRKKENKT